MLFVVVLLLLLFLLLLLLPLLCPTQFASGLLAKLFVSRTINEQSRAKQVGAIFNTCQEAETTNTLTQRLLCSRSPLPLLSLTLAEHV